jgi:hypothetical protein
MTFAIAETLEGVPIRLSVPGPADKAKDGIGQLRLCHYRRRNPPKRPVWRRDACFIMFI